MAVRVARAPGAPPGGAIVSTVHEHGAPAAQKGNGVGLGFVSKDYADLFRELNGNLANKDPIELKPPYRVQRAAPEDLRGGYNPVGIVCAKVRLPGERFSVEAIAKGEYMKWAVVESLSETVSRIGGVRVRPEGVLPCADQIEILDVQMPFLGEHLWQFCEFRFDFRVAVKSHEDAEKVVFRCFHGMVDFEAEFCRNLELKFRNIYHITVLGLLNKRYLLADGQRHSDELALFEAAQANDTKAMEAFIRRGVDIESTHRAMSFPGALLEEEQRFLYVELGRTPLLAAAEGGNLEAMRLLLDAQADVNFQDAAGFHSLYLAAGVPQRSADIVRFLLERDADVSLANASGYTPLHNACGSDAVAALAPLLQAGADLNAKSRAGAAPIHVAVVNGAAGVLEAMAARRANLDLPAFGGNTPVHEAVMNNDPAMIQKLLELRADVNVESGPDHDFATPLRMAIDRKKKKAAKKLRELGALEQIEHEYEDVSGEELVPTGGGEAVQRRVVGRSAY